MASIRAGMPWNWAFNSSTASGGAKAVNILPNMPIALLIWVMGFEAAKAGKLPTPEQHAEIAACCTRRWMPAPRLVGPAHAADRPAAVQRDYDARDADRRHA
jgi:hypothetical protein